MANSNAPRGFVPKRHTNGSPFNGQFTPCIFAASDVNPAWIGDAVVVAGSAGTVGQAVSGYDVEGVITVTRATVGTTGQNIFGVVMGFAVDPLAMGSKYRAASTLRFAYVITDPTVVYEIQEDALVAPIAAASIGLNAAFLLGVGNNFNGISGMLLDSDSVGTAATLPLKVLGLVKRPDNFFNTGGVGTDQAKFEVSFNTGIWMPNNVGIA